MEKQYIKSTEPGEAVLLKYIRSEVSEPEKAEIESWLAASMENEKILLQIASIYYQQQKVRRIAARNTDTAFDAVQYRIKNHTLKIWLRRVSAVAACIAGVFIISFMVINKNNHPETSTVQTVKVQANAGMRTSFNLPDGTIVYLNSGSTLSYPLSFSSAERHVSLIGEAYFKVVHNPEQPFIVSVSDDKMQVRVLGTEFNLQAYSGENSIQTTLISGRVNLQFYDKEGKQHEQQLVPSERAFYDLTAGRISIQKINTVYDTAWMEGKLMFKDAPLPQVLKKLSYFYNVTFEVKDPVIESYCFTGMFENRQLSQILDYLKISSDIDYRINQVTSDDSHGTKRTNVILWKRKG